MELKSQLLPDLPIHIGGKASGPFVLRADEELGLTRCSACPGAVARERGTPGRHSRPYGGGARPESVAREGGTLPGSDWGAEAGGFTRLDHGLTHPGHESLTGKSSP